MSPKAEYPRMPIHIIKDEENGQRQKQRGNRPQISPYDYPDRPPEEVHRKDDKPQSGVTEWQMK
jgi:hypothetical protein